MRQNRVAVVIPALNEAQSIGDVIEHIPKAYRDCVVVADNGSTDATVTIARSAGAYIATAPVRGYGSACLAGIDFALQFQPEIIAFLDADYSDFPEDMTSLISELEKNALDLVIGSRASGLAEPGALLPQARFGNWLATRLMHLRYGYLFSDLGPFRAIRVSALRQIGMKDRNFGWTVEMQVKALRDGLRVGEVPVRYRRRTGVSKITGTFKGTVLAGAKILWTIGRYGLWA